MWQVWHAWGALASATEKLWRVWQASQEARPNTGTGLRRSARSASDFKPILWQPPQPFIPSIRATGWAWAMGIAFMAAQAKACLPFLNCATLSSWHWAHVSGVGISAAAKSASVLCFSPWQVSSRRRSGCACSTASR